VHGGFPLGTRLFRKTDTTVNESDHGKAVVA
jgi:hypothetical protein